MTEVGRVVGDGAKLITKGYGEVVIHPSGVGVSHTHLWTRGDNIDFNHDYFDLSYTFGPSWLVSLGASVAIDGRATIDGATSKSVTGGSYFIGPGYEIGFFEVYWICRQNNLRYSMDDHASARNARLRHCQLGLGANF